MYEKVKAFVEKEHLLGKEDRVIAGVSGGADSVCLLFMLLELREETGCEVVAVHVHHGLRGETADADEAYVRRLCREQQVELVVCHEDVRGFAKAHKLTEEEAGREIRRQAFLRVMEERRGTCIALAHHQNDGAETLLWNLCRGTGLAGLGGIAPKNGVWVRPLLCLKREEIESYLENRGISYCTDETNLEDAYTRNRIRNHVMPYLEQHVNRQAVQHMAETMEQMRELGAYVEEEVRRYKDRCTEKKEGAVLLKKEEFQQVPGALRSYVLHELLCEAAGRRKDIEKVHMKMAEELLERQVGRSVDLPYGIRASRTYEGILFDGKTGATGKTESEKPHFQTRIFEIDGKTATFPETPYTKWFDYDIIKNTVKMRHREPGDVIAVTSDGGTQKLKQYFINEKIPQDKRDHIWLIADGTHIMWIVGYRQSKAYQITDKTRHVLEIKICGGEEDGRDSKGISS